MTSFRYPCQNPKEKSKTFAYYTCSQFRGATRSRNFLSPLTLADIAKVFADDSKSEKGNFRSAKIVSSVSKIFDRFLNN